jgi:hypothetical protein
MLCVIDIATLNKTLKKKKKKKKPSSGALKVKIFANQINKVFQSNTIYGGFKQGSQKSAKISYA